MVRISSDGRNVFWSRWVGGVRHEERQETGRIKQCFELRVANSGSHHAKLFSGIFGFPLNDKTERRLQ